MDILEALATLDVENDEQWTADGLPKVDLLAELTDNDKLTRAQIMGKAPEFTRDFIKEAQEKANVKTRDETDSTKAPDEKVDDPETAAKAASEGDKPKEDDTPPEPPAPPIPQPSLEERLAIELSTLQAEMADITRGQADLDRARKELAAKIGFVGGQLDQARANSPLNSGIQQYLETQNQVRLEKAECLAELKASGLGEILKTMGKSALDKAMNARKPARGSVRPTYQPPRV